MGGLVGWLASKRDRDGRINGRGEGQENRGWVTCTSEGKRCRELSYILVPREHVGSLVRYMFVPI